MPSAKIGTAPKSSSNYQVAGCVGNGAFGTVWRALDSKTGRLCAIKRVALDERFQNRELSMMHMLRHDNVVRLWHSFETREDDTTWLHLVMDYVPTTLRT